MNARDSESTALQVEGIDSPTSPRQPSEPRFREYRAPQRHGEALISPAFSRVPDLLRDNIELLGTQESLASLRRVARRQLIDDALRYTSAYRDISWFDKSASEGSPILMAGHQPAIFHAGVWFKNFALSRLAQQTSSVAVNLVIDNDVASGSSIRVPTLDPESGRAVYRSVPYDEAGGGVPYEQTTIDDRELFDSFDRRVREVVAPLVKDPCVTELWKHARHAIRALRRCRLRDRSGSPRAGRGTRAANVGIANWRDLSDRSFL